MDFGIEWGVAGILATLAIARYLLARRKPRSFYGSGLTQIEEYRPPVSVLLNYRDAAGATSERRVSVMRSLRSREDHLYLFGVTRKGRKPRTFRVDRIGSMKTANGKPLDKRRFLIDRLCLPRELCV